MKEELKKTISNTIQQVETLRQDVLTQIFVLALNEAQPLYPDLEGSEVIVKFDVNCYNDENYFKCIDEISIDGWIFNNYKEHGIIKVNGEVYNDDGQSDNPYLLAAIQAIIDVFSSYNDFLQSLNRSFMLIWDNGHFKVTWGAMEDRNY